jgi:hypothetical protein
LAVFFHRDVGCCRCVDKALNKAADASNEANRLNAVGLRPWVDFDTLDIDTGFTITKDSANLGVKFSLKNSGKLPAMMTNQNFQIRPTSIAPGQENEISDLIKEDQIEVCKKAEYPTGNTVFPGQTLVEPYRIIIPSSRRAFDSVAQLGKPIFVVLITGCVGYQIITPGKYGHTGVSILVRRGSGAGPLNLPSEGTIDASQLVKFRAAIQLAD